MAKVIAADVVVPLELAIVLAKVPVLARHHAVAQASVVQHWQVEAAAIPAHQVRHVSLHRAEEGLNDLPLLALAIGLAVDERMHLQPLGVAEYAGDDQDALQMK